MQNEEFGKERLVGQGVPTCRRRKVVFGGGWKRLAFAEEGIDTQFSGRSEDLADLADWVILILILIAVPSDLDEVDIW
jgi:hypothetical protein